MTFIFNTNIPAANNNPSVDQPDMLGNNQATNDILAVDHITFNNSDGGRHKQVTFNSKIVPTTQLDPTSVLYTNNVIATATNTASASTVASLFFRNQNSGMAPANNSFPVSMIRAFGCFDAAGNPLNTWNLSITLPAGHPSAGNFLVDIPANVVTGTSYLVMVSNTGTAGNTTLQNSYTIMSATQVLVQFVKLNVSFLNPDQFSIVILQL